MKEFLWPEKGNEHAHRHWILFTPFTMPPSVCLRTSGV